MQEKDLGFSLIASSVVMEAKLGKLTTYNVSVYVLQVCETCERWMCNWNITIIQRLADLVSSWCSDMVVNSFSRYMAINNTMTLDSCILLPLTHWTLSVIHESAWFTFCPICISALIGPVHGGLTKCLMFLGHLVDLVQWFNQWRIKFGSLPKDQIRCQWNEAICWECVSEVAMQQTDNHTCKWVQLFLLETDHYV